jgi:hypothetical protein
MADPKKDTVRIALPTRSEQAAADLSAAKHDTARIVLPSRPPVPSIRRVPPKITSRPSAESAAEAPSIILRRPPTTPLASPASSPLLQPLPKPPGTEADPGSAIQPVPPARDESATDKPSGNRGPKNETARINVLPHPTPVAGPATNMTKTQPMLIHPTGSVPLAPVVITSKPVAPADVIPRSLAWGLLAVSALIFLIQIWNYVVS